MNLEDSANFMRDFGAITVCAQAYHSRSRPDFFASKFLSNVQVPSVPLAAACGRRQRKVRPRCPRMLCGGQKSRSSALAVATHDEIAELPE
eukprot:3071507-Amphidinium_carterae.1